MTTPGLLRRKFIDGTLAALEAVAGRRALNRLGGYVYWRTRGENLDLAEHNGEYRTLDTLARSVLGPAPLALDVGANRGDWSERFLRGAPGGRVIAVEPVVATCRAMQARLAAEPRAECVHAALSDRAGTVELRVGPVSGADSIYAHTGVRTTHVETIPALTGDALLAARGLRAVDFLKADVEGHELAVLRGFGDAIAGRRVRFIQFEYNKTWLAARITLRDMFELLEPAGYRLCKLRPRDLLLYPRYALALDNFCYSNWLAVAEPEFASVRAHLRVTERTAHDW